MKCPSCFVFWDVISTVETSGFGLGISDLSSVLGACVIKPVCKFVNLFYHSVHSNSLQLGVVHCLEYF